MKQKKLWSLAVILPVIILFSGCFGKPKPTEIKVFFPDYTWNRFAPLDAKFEIGKINRTYEITVSLSVIDGFELDEVPLEILITSPDGQENILNRVIPVKNEGKYLGTAYGDVWTTELRLYSAKQFLQAGTYSVFIQNRTQYYELYKVEALSFTVRPMGKIKNDE